MNRAIIDENLPAPYAAAYHVLQLATFPITVENSVPIDRVKHTWAILQGIRLPDPSKYKPTAVEKDAVRRLIYPSISIFILCGRSEAVEDIPTIDTLLAQLWNNKTKGRHEFGLELLAGLDRLTAAKSPMVKTGWQITTKQALKRNQNAERRKKPAHDQKKKLGRKEDSDSSDHSSSDSNPSPDSNAISSYRPRSESLEQQIAAIDPNLTPAAHLAEVERLTKNAKSRQKHLDNRATNLKRHQELKQRQQHWTRAERCVSDDKGGEEPGWEEQTVFSRKWRRCE